MCVNSELPLYFLAFALCRVVLGVMFHRCVSYALWRSEIITSNLHIITVEYIQFINISTNYLEATAVNLIMNQFYYIQKDLFLFVLKALKDNTDSLFSLSLCAVVISVCSSVQLSASVAFRGVCTCLPACVVCQCHAECAESRPGKSRSFVQLPGLHVFQKACVDLQVLVQKAAC